MLMLPFILNKRVILVRNKYTNSYNSMFLQDMLIDKAISLGNLKVVGDPCNIAISDDSYNDSMTRYKSNEFLISWFNVIRFQDSKIPRFQRFQVLFLTNLFLS